MKIFQKIKIKNKQGKTRIIVIFGFPLLRFDIKKLKDGSKKTDIYLPGFFKDKQNNSNYNHVFYLKVNRNNNSTFVNLQHWIEIAEAMNAKYYIVCDNDKLKENIYKRVCFANPDIKFLKSCKNKRLKKIVNSIATGVWKNATYAHLTTFFHAKQQGTVNFWNIDADDTVFCMEPEKCAEALNQIEQYACKNDINFFSLDMWRSSTYGRHWSFGVTFVRGNENSFDIIEKKCANNWKNNYTEYAASFNLDWFFNYLKDNGYLSIETFYIENCMFFHCGDFYNVIGSHASLWHDGKIYYPIMSEIYGDKKLGILPVANDCIKFDTGIEKEYCQNYALKNLTFLTRMPEQLKKLHNIPEEYSPMS